MKSLNITSFKTDQVTKYVINGLMPQFKSILERKVNRSNAKRTQKGGFF